jgi:hypothetical protein
LSAGGCLVTEPIELQAEPTTPPIVTSLDPNLPVGSIIKFDASKSRELQIRLQVRDEDTAEPLTVRWRILSGNKAPTMETCPDVPLAANGTLTREWQLNIAETALDRGTCSRIEIAASSSFFSCVRHPDPLYFDRTMDDDNDLGRAWFWVWEVSNSPLMDPNQLPTLVSTCPAVDYPITTSAPASTGN